MNLLEAILKLDEAYLAESKPLQNIVGKKEYKEKGLSEEDLLKIIRQDPTSEVDSGKAGDYSEWLIRGVLKNQEITQELIDALRIYDDAKKKKAFPEDKKNIDVFKTFEQLIKYTQDTDLKNQTEVQQTHGIKPMMTTSRFTVYQPKTYEESVKLRGDDAVWCTGDHRSSSNWEYYTRTRDLYILYDNGTKKPVYQFSVNRETKDGFDLKDARDESIYNPCGEIQGFREIAENFLKSGIINDSSFKYCISAERKKVPVDESGEWSYVLCECPLSGERQVIITNCRRYFDPYDEENENIVILSYVDGKAIKKRGDSLTRKDDIKFIFCSVSVILELVKQGILDEYPQWYPKFKELLDLDSGDQICILYGIPEYDEGCSEILGIATQRRDYQLWKFEYGKPDYEYWPNGLNLTDDEIMHLFESLPDGIVNAKITEDEDGNICAILSKYDKYVLINGLFEYLPAFGRGKFASIPKDFVESISLVNIKEEGDTFSEFEWFPKIGRADSDWWAVEGRDQTSVWVEPDGRRARWYWDPTEVLGVRPQITLSKSISDILRQYYGAYYYSTGGEVVECLGSYWYVRNDQKLISVGCVGWSKFADSVEPYRHSADYDGSAVQKYLNDWLNKKLQEPEK